MPGENARRVVACLLSENRGSLKADEARTLSVFDKHQLKIARDTLRMTDAGASVMGGMTKEEAREIILRLTGRRPYEHPEPDVGEARAVVEEKSDQTLTNDAKYVLRTLRRRGLDKPLLDDPDGARQRLLVMFSADKEDVIEPGFWNLFSNMERGDIEIVADKVIAMLDDNL